MKFSSLIAVAAIATGVVVVDASKAVAATCVIRDFRVVRIVNQGGAKNKIYVDFSLTSGGSSGVIDPTVYFKPPSAPWTYLGWAVGGEPGCAAYETVDVTDTYIDLPRNCPYKLEIYFGGQFVNSPGTQAPSPV
jgi:hypothetical protein